MRAARGDDGRTDEATHGDTAAVEAIFTRKRELRKAVNALMAEGVPTNTIGVYLVDDAGNRRRRLPVESGSGALKGALIGAGAGAVVGLAIVALVLGGVFGPASVELFGIGSLLGAVRAVAMGAAAGVPLGALIGMGHWQGGHRVPGADLDHYRAAVVVESDAKADVARRVLDDAGAREVTG